MASLPSENPSTKTDGPPQDPTLVFRNARWQCQLCNRRFRKASASHLRSHGYSPEHYRRVFGGAAALLPPTAQPAAAISVIDPTRGAVEAAARLAVDPRFVAEVGEAMLNGPLRDRLSYSLACLLETRAKTHASAVDRLTRINEELGADWRIKQGGEGGTPTDTKELVSMHLAAHAEVRSSEELFTKAMKLAIEESKGRKDAALMVPEGLERYTGSAEKVPVPTSLTAGDRESVRVLLSRLKEGMVARRKGVPVLIETTAAPVSVQGSAPAQAPLPPSPAPVSVPAPLDLTATPVRGVDEPF
jgi:hypothetical protein